MIPFTVKLYQKDSDISETLHIIKKFKTMLHTASILVTVWHTLCMEWKVYLMLNVGRIKVFFPCWNMDNILFYYSSFCAVGFVEFVSSLINLFSCFSQQVCSPFEKEKRKERKKKQKSIWMWAKWDLNFSIHWTLKYVSPYGIILTSSFTTEQKISNYICITPKDN